MKENAKKREVIWTPSRKINSKWIHVQMQDDEYWHNADEVKYVEYVEE